MGMVSIFFYILFHINKDLKDISLRN